MECFFEFPTIIIVFFVIFSDMHAFPGRTPFPKCPCGDWLRCWSAKERNIGSRGGYGGCGTGGVSILGSVPGCTTGQGLELWGVWPSPLWRWAVGGKHAKGSCPTLQTWNPWQLTLPLTFSLTAACLTKKKVAW